jgi:hypothetical protein
VHDPGGVRGRQRGGDLRPDPGDLLRRQRALLGDHRGQAAGRQVLHDQPRLAVLLGDVVHGDRVRVREPGGDPALPHGPQPRLLGLRRGQPRLEQQLLDRYCPM